MISVVKWIESRLALFLLLASANDDRPPDNCFSNCIDFSRKRLARETLPCVCCRKIPALEIKATVVMRRAASLVPEMDNGAHRGTRPAFTSGVFDRPSSECFDGQRKHVANAAFGQDDARRAIGLQLAPQAQHLNVDTTIEDIFVDAGRLQKVLAG